MISIRNLRKNLGLSQAELAQKLNVHQTAVSQWENGRTMPDVDSLKRIAEIFGVSVDVLLGRDPNIILNTTEEGYVVVTGKEPEHIPLTGVAMSEDKKWSRFKMEQPKNEQKNKPVTEDDRLREENNELFDQLPKDKQQEALNYLRFLVEHQEKE
jgi:transcriptional regulator with XRE-family HTH domain